MAGALILYFFTIGVVIVWSIWHDRTCPDCNPKKRGLIGVYHRVSFKHLGRYVNEFSFRLNEGNVKIHTLDRLDSFVDGMADKRLTYNALTH